MWNDLDFISEGVTLETDASLGAGAKQPCPPVPGFETPVARGKKCPPKLQIYFWCEPVLLLGGRIEGGGRTRGTLGN